MTVKKGFTLVELSIVLVIIGLIIGGILVTRSMTGAAKIQAQIIQFQQIEAAVSNFKVKYNGLPGDTLAFNGPATAYGDGRIGGRLVSVPGYYEEVGMFWNQMSLTGFSTNGQGTNGVFQVGSSGVAITPSGPNANIMKAKIGKNNSCIIAYSNQLNLSDINNYYGIFTADIYPDSAFLWAAQTPSIAAVTPADALALDTKIDDGLATSGSVTAGGIISSAPFRYLNPNTSPSGCTNGDIYLVDTQSEQCTPHLRMGTMAAYNKD